MTHPQVAQARQWLRAHPLALDALLSLAVLGFALCVSVTESRTPDGGSGFGKRHLAAHTLALYGLAAAALTLRRVFPKKVLLTVGATAMLELFLGTRSYTAAERHSSIVIFVVVALFTVALATDRATTLKLGLLTTALFTPAAMVMGVRPWYDPENLGVFAWTALAAAMGEAVRTRRAMVDAIRERAERAERTREEEARRRVAEERMRIARELHDVVAHHIALVNVQAGVASHVMSTRPDQAMEALGHIRHASRRALAELQTTVGLLRHQDEPIAPTEPVRGLGVLDELVEGFAQAGMAVTVEAPGAAEPLPSAVDLAAYRVVQEALTNVHKHAGPEATARVRIVRSGGAAGAALHITVEDDGPRPAGDGGERGDGEEVRRRNGSGHGLTGMRERATALSGTCEAGPRDDGGFRVRVTLPLQAPPRPPESGVEPRERPTARRGGWCA
ncbi:sensor histidine kinase [Streptomyces sp. URMC 129]|uniref:sensor histidine kinase n=1 Tax=Streptomyces sp. URMC 129 TaxID=3423407 RepID=UPI003F1DCB5F